ncbi:MAG: flippase activity-associated protein Agl23, partial [Candidatus Methanospirareceae archaeon]
MLFALILRLKDVASFPFDFDEGIHGYFSYMLYKKGVYQYVADVHGPFLYYATAGVFALLGDSIATARLAPALFSTAMILLLY